MRDQYWTILNRSAYLNRLVSCKPIAGIRTEFSILNTYYMHLFFGLLSRNHVMLQNKWQSLTLSHAPLYASVMKNVVVRWWKRQHSFFQSNLRRSCPQYSSKPHLPNAKQALYFYGLNFTVSELLIKNQTRLSWSKSYCVMTSANCNSVVYSFLLVPEFHHRTWRKKQLVDKFKIVCFYSYQCKHPSWRRCNQSQKLKKVSWCIIKHFHISDEGLIKFVCPKIIASRIWTIFVSDQGETPCSLKSERPH